MKPCDMICPICNEPWLKAMPDRTGEFEVGYLKRLKCSCESKRAQVYDKMQLVIHRQDCIIENRRYGFFDPSYMQHTFTADDGKNPEITQKCLAYVNNWEAMSANNMGAIFYGPSGTGKTFFACCIANAILENKINSFTRRGDMFPCNEVIIATLPTLVDKLASKTFSRKGDLLKDISMSALLVIDDLGAERLTPYMQGEVFSIINARLLSGKPLIVTTNLTPSELKEPAFRVHARIYHKVLEMCGNFPVLVSGESRWLEIAAKKREEFDKLLVLSK